MSPKNKLKSTVLRYSREHGRHLRPLPPMLHANGGPSVDQSLTMSCTEFIVPRIVKTGRQAHRISIWNHTFRICLLRCVAHLEEAVIKSVARTATPEAFGKCDQGKHDLEKYGS